MTITSTGATRTTTPQDGRRLAWCELGDDTGRPVVYCHGQPGSRLEQAHAAALAQRRGLRIIVPDRPGYGASDPSPGRAAGDFAAFAQALDGALEQAGGAYGMLIGGAPPVDQAIFADPSLAKVYRADLEEALRPGLDGILDDARAVVDDWRVDFDRIRCTTGIWHGTDDPNAPVAMGRWLRDTRDGAALTGWPGAGHFESFRRWSEVLDFLET